MIVGVDVGYSHTKGVCKGQQVIFPSVVGSGESSSFSLPSGYADRLMVVNGESRHVGHGAVEQSRFVERREDRNWIESEEYQVLLHTALHHLLPYRETVNLVTGLPIAYYDDRDRLRDILDDSDIEIYVHGTSPGSRHEFSSIRVIPQPFGTLFSLAFDDGGGVVDPSLLTGEVGIIDIGGHTTNLLVVHQSRDVHRLTDSIDTGAWEVIRGVRRDLQVQCPDLNLRDHQLIRDMTLGTVQYYGESVDIRPIVDGYLQPFLQRIISVVSQLWNGGAGLDTVLVTGGGSCLIGNEIKGHLHRHSDVRLVENPVFANCTGYFRFGQYMEESDG